MPRATAARFLPDLVGTATATGIGMIPLHRLPRSVRLAYVALPAALTTGTTLLAMRHRSTDPADGADAGPTAEPQAAAPARGLPTATELVIPLALGGLVAGAGAASIGIDRGIETLLRRWGVPAPRVWMGIAYGALSHTMVTLGDRRVVADGPEDAEGPGALTSPPSAP